MPTIVRTSYDIWIHPCCMVDYIQETSKHFVEQHVVVTLAPGDKLEIGDSSATSLAAYDTLAVSYLDG